MDSLHLDQLLAAAVFIGARVAGLMVYCPFLGSERHSAAARKHRSTLLITALVYALHGPLQLDLNAWQWAGSRPERSRIGLLLGLTANFMMEAPMMAGQILGVQMGYSLATLFDPQTQADTPVLAEFHRLAALLIFLQLNVHHWLLRAVVRSFAYLPAGAAPRQPAPPPAACCMRRGQSFSPECRLPRPVWPPRWWPTWRWAFSEKPRRSFPYFSSVSRSKTCWDWPC